MDKALLYKICQLTEQGEHFAIVTVVSTKGSTPRKAGASMIVERNGIITGTIGGGCAEAEVKLKALSAIDKLQSSIYEVKMLNDVAEEEGMVCGGVMEVFIQVT
ncbi:MAG: XdhC family protein [Desulfitobacterium hafniense]|nr:XdhC family protein [Desulfitobacterium hafniense]